MSAPSGVSLGWIAGMYALVCVAGWGVWQVQQRRTVEPAATIEPRAGQQPPADAAALPPASDPPAVVGSDSRSAETILAQANARAVAAGSPPALMLPESAPSSEPAVRERQKRIALGVGAALAGYRPFDDANPWNQRIDDAPVDPSSETLIRSLGAERGLHPCFGSGEWEGALIGIPYVVVSSAQPLAPIEFTEYPDESDPGPYPIPPRAPIEGDPSVEADRHVLVLDRDRWMLYELFHAFEVGGGWKASSGAVWDLASNAGRPAGWTSADAAGLPVFPGLVRYDEVAAGEIRHALRFTASTTRRAYVPPASHWASPHRSAALPPLGMRVRLKRDFDVTKFPREAQVILRCLQTYGMILADNGSDWFISGAPDERWDNDALHTIRQVQGRHFEVLRMDGLVSE